MGILEIRNLKAFVGKKEILKNINISFERGKFYGIIGPNGSGKSTFLKCIYRILKPFKGTIYIDDTNINKISMKENAKKMPAPS